MINMQYKTNIDFIAFFASDDDFNSHLEQLSKENLSASEFKSKSLKAQLDWYYAKYLEWEKLYSYNEVKSDLNLNNQIYNQNKEIINRIKSYLDSLKNIINEEIMSIDMSLEEYLAQNKELKDYYMVFYNVMRKKNHLDESGLSTKILPYVSRINSLYNTLMNVEFPAEEIVFNGETIKLTTKNYNSLMLKATPEERKNLAATYFQSLSKINKTISSLLNMRYQMFQDLATEAGYSSILEHVLDEDDLSIKITDNLLKNANDSLESLKKYYTLRRQELGLDEMHFYDRREGKDESKIDFDTAVNNVIKALSPLGSEYLKRLEEILNRGLIDVYPRENKYPGGYHLRNYTQSLIVMNSHDTIAHELGHAVNSSFIKETHQFSDFHFSNFLSEVTSLTNEILMADYYFEQASTDEEKVIILEQKIGKFIANVYSSIMWFEFEEGVCKAIQNGRPKTPDEMIALYQKLYQKYNPEIVCDDYLKYGYVTRLHYFMGNYCYYNFQYATGMIMATKLANDIKNNVSDSREKYLQFLHVGGSMPTLEALKVAGLDLTNEEIIADGFKYFSKDVASYEKLVLKRQK
mgnify:CR=1 FL=1